MAPPPITTTSRDMVALWSKSRRKANRRRVQEVGVVARRRGRQRTLENHDGVARIARRSAGDDFLGEPQRSAVAEKIDVAARRFEFSGGEKLIHEHEAPSRQNPGGR